MSAVMFKTRVPFEERKSLAADVLKDYPGRIPVIVERALKTDLPEIERKKFLVPVDLAFSQMAFVIRKRLKVTAEKTIFLFVDTSLPSSNEQMSDLYAKHKEKDGLLYITYSAENTFGSDLSL